MMHKIGENKPIYCSKMGHKNLLRHFSPSLNYQPHRKWRGELKLGKRTLAFLETKMLHWPDSMVTYAKEDKILFSSDAFGQHYAGLERFDDQIGETIMHYARKYFANILLLYSDLILKLAEKITALGLVIDIICPDHGIIWRKDPGKIINAYVEWSTQKPKRKALVIYDTMWQSTRKMAETIVEGLGEEGVETKSMHVRAFHRSDIITEILDAGAIIIGSPTLNNGLYPTVSDFLTYLKGLRPKNKIATAFGSYGWSGEAVKLIIKELDEMKFKVIDPGLMVQSCSEPRSIGGLFPTGKKIGGAL